MQKKSVKLPTDLRRENYREILDVIGNLKEFTIQDIVDKVTISRQTIAKAIEYYESIGLVESLGKGSSTAIGGKRPEKYSLIGSHYVICICSCNKKSVYNKKVSYELKYLKI